MNDQTESQTLYTEDVVPKVTSALVINDGAHVHRQKAKWTKLLALTGVATTIGTTVPVGYALGCVNSPAQHIQKWANETLIARYQLALSADALAMLWSSVVSIFLVGGAIGSLSGAWIADKFGRKLTVLISNALLIIAASCIFSCRIFNLVELLLFGRFLLGLASGICIACLPMYLSEIAPLDLRGTLGVFCVMGLCGGLMVGQIFTLSSIFGTEQHWHIALSFYVWLTLAALMAYKWFPESPKWLYVMKKNVKAAELELQRLRHASESALIAMELESMKVEAEESSLSMSFWEVFKDSRYSLPLLLVFVGQFGQQLAGINAIFYYSVSIFQRAGLTAAAAEWANFGAGCLNFAMSMCAPQLMAKYNRRPLMLVSSFFCCVSLVAFVLMLFCIEAVSWAAIVCIACIFLYIIFFQVGIGPIPYFIAAELFEVSPRPVAMAFGSLANFSGNFIVGMTFPSLQNAWGSLSFMPFIITLAGMFTIIYFYLPETKTRSPTEIAEIVSKGFRSKVRN